MFVNNEIGTINELAPIGRLCRERGVLFHVDAAQAAGKVPVNVDEIGADLLSVSAHKVYGPKGAGALYLRGSPKSRLEPLIHGGGHEWGMRSGTLATHQVVGMGEAFRIAARSRPPRPCACGRCGPAVGGHRRPRRRASQRRCRAARRRRAEREFRGRGGREPAVRCASWRSPAARPALRPAARRPTCCGRWDATTSWRKARCASASGGSAPPRKWTSRSASVREQVDRLRALGPAAANATGRRCERAGGRRWTIHGEVRHRFETAPRHGRVLAAPAERRVGGAGDDRPRRAGRVRGAGARRPDCGVPFPRLWLPACHRGGLVGGGARRGARPRNEASWLEPRRLAELLEAPAHKLGSLLVVEDAYRACVARGRRAQEICRTLPRWGEPVPTRSGGRVTRWRLP
jgi:hypothetical protein